MTWARFDLLVAEKDVYCAGDILRAHGYQRFDPQAYLTPRRLRSYIAHQKDFSYEHPATGVVIDLHWRLFRNQSLSMRMYSGKERWDCVSRYSSQITPF